MFGKNYEFGSMDRELNEEVEQHENKPEQLNIHTELAIQIHELYYKRLLSKKEVEDVLLFLQEKSHGKDNYNTLELLHLIKKNDYELADKIVNLAKGTDESLLDEDNIAFEDEMEKREREDNEFYGTNTAQFIQKLEKDGFEKSVIEEWIEKGKEFSTSMNGTKNIHRLPDDMIDDDTIAFVKSEYHKNISTRKLGKLFETLPETQQTLIENMRTYSAGDQNAMTLDKIDVAKEIIDSSLVQNTPANKINTVYYGSADDLELPMLANLESITMVDPGLVPEQVDSAVKRVREFYDADATFDESRQLLTFTYNDRDFSIQFFGIEMEEFNQNTEKQFDIALTFNKAPWMTQKEMKKHLQKEGLVFDNRDFYEEDGPDFSNIPNASQFD